MSLEKYSSQKVADRILSTIENLLKVKQHAETLVQEALADDWGDAEEEGKQEAIERQIQVLDRVLSGCEHHLEATRNAVLSLVKSVLGENVDENGEMEVDVVPDDHGLRF
jgi:hypothetical protein